MVIYNLDARCKNILNTVVNTHEYIKIKEISLENNVSVRSIYYDIDKINEWLKMHNIDEITIERRKGILVSKIHAKNIKRILELSDSNADYLFTPARRVQIIICSIIKKSKPLFIEEFMTLCKVSRNTIISDLKMVSNRLKKYNLELVYEAKKGYLIKGDFIKKGSLFFLYFSEISKYYHKEIIPLEDKDKIYEIYKRLKDIEDALCTKYVSGALFALATFCFAVTNECEALEFADGDEEEIKGTDEYKLVKRYFFDFTHDYQVYITLHLLGSRLQALPMNLMVDDNDETYELAERLVKEFSNIACVEFPRKDAITAALFAHLKTSLYRYKYGIQLVNPMLESIKKEYSELFNLTKKACSVLRRELEVPIPDSEIAYLTLHFGGPIVDSKTENTELKILLICPNGVSTGNMLKAEVNSLIPHASKIDNIMLADFSEHHDYDVVISTVEIPGYHEALVVRSILTDTDRVTILRKCMVYTQETKTDIDEIVNLAVPYMNKDAVSKFKRDLNHHFASLTTGRNSPRRNFGLRMLNYLKPENVAICNWDYNWKEAIIFASVPLLNNNSIEERYVYNIIEKCDAMGPYMFITENVVLAHAGIEDGVNKRGISMAVFKKPICFSDDRKAEVIIVLAANDRVGHIRILSDIMTIFSSAYNTEELIKKNSSEDILRFIEQVLNSKE